MTGSGGNRVVIVEDEAVVALDLDRTLRALGFDVRGVAADSDAAVDLARREKPDLVLMDIRIQGVRDGIDTAAQLRTELDLPVVFLTAHGDAATIERAHRARPLGYLLKPFKRPDLQNVVSIALARNREERELRRREEMLHTTLDCIDEAILSTDLEGQIVYGNPAAATLLGRDTSAWVDRPLQQELPLRRASGDSILEQVRAQRRVHLEGTLPVHDREKQVVGTAAMVEAGAHQFGIVVVLQDLTELFLARRQLEFAERLSALGTLAAGVAHELNNPLSVVLANVRYAVEESAGIAPASLQALQEAADAGDRMRRIVQELQTFSRPQQEAHRAVDPVSAMGAALRMTRARWRPVAGVRIELRPTPRVNVSPTRLTQVFVNLVINAVQAMEPRGGGQLVLRACTGPGGEAVLSVTDDGPGIPEALRERIFEPFFTTKEVGKGTGLGLAISRTIIENYRGALEVGPGDGGLGTTFTLRLPPVEAEPETLPPVVWLSEEPAPAGCHGVPPALELVKETMQKLPPGAAVLVALQESQKGPLRDLLTDLEGRWLDVRGEARRGELCVAPGFDVKAVSALFQTEQG